MDEYTTALTAGYDAAFIRVAPPVLALTNYASVEAMKAGEALTSTEDILIGIGLLKAHFGVDPLTTRIVANDAAALDRKEDYTDAQAAMLGGVARSSNLGVIGVVQKCANYLVELTMCWQVKPLKRSNLLNYFKSAGVIIQTTDFITKVVKVTAAKANKLVGFEALRDIALTNKFVAYHIAYATSGALVHKVATELGTIAPYVFTAEELAHAQAASAAPWDIPLSEAVNIRSRVVAYAYLDALDVLPENWYQGTAAWESASTMAKRDLIMTFKQLKRLTAGDPRFRDVTTRNNFLACMPDSVVVIGAPDRPAFVDGM